ncbi:MAG TPA: tetratricopeptide repeat protein [Polyangiaceae bacterium]|nr:tetratricopeptide repeat protein [Polyangiaceae bacterium]
MKHFGFAVFAFCAFCASSAAASPTIWQRAISPESAKSQLLLNRIERILGTVGLPGSEFAEGVIAMSQLSDARWSCAGVKRRLRAPGDASAPDARLEFLIGEALIDAPSDRTADARCVLEQALKDAPASPLAADGWSDLAVAYAKLGDEHAARAAYVHALELDWDSEDRARLYTNLAETDMDLGQLKLAISEYRVALSSAGRADHVTAAYFGLAVALDRFGDFPAALDAASRAIAMPLPQTMFGEVSVLDLPGTFFTPEYEIHYYKALRAMALARAAKDPTSKREALSDAAEEWAAYLVRAEVDRTPWVQPARLHQASVERELAKYPAPRAEPAAVSPAELTPL